MKSFKKVLCVFLSILFVVASPVTAFAETITNSPFKVDVDYSHQSQFDEKTILNGIDLSNHNGTVDFDKVKASGVDFVILRLGARGYGYAGSFVNDTKFAEYYDEARRVGLPIGAYFFSQALNEKEAVAEAEKALSLLKGRTLDLPLTYDYEFSGNADGRLNSAWKEKKINRKIMTNNAVAFCEKIKENGYEPMVYASKFFFYDNLNTPVLEEKGYGIWLAHYINKTDYNSQFNIWQYSSTGAVDGIKGNVDCNFMYVDNITDLPKPVVSLNSVATRSAKIECEEVEGADGYEVTRKVGENYVPINTIEGTSIKITGLNPASTYYFCFRAYKLVDGVKYFGEYSKKVKVVTNPSKVGGIKLVSRTNKSIKLTWNKDGNPTSYNVYMFNKETNEYELVKTVTTNSATISGLEENTYYKFKVEACKNEVVGTISNKFGIHTTPISPTVKKVTSPKKKKIKMTWKKNTKNAGYQVEWSTTKDFSSNTKKKTFKGKKTTSGTIETYRTKEKYYVRVRAYVLRNDKKVYSPWSKCSKIKVK